MNLPFYRRIALASFVLIVVGCFKPPEPIQLTFQNHFVGQFKILLNPKLDGDLPRTNGKKQVAFNPQGIASVSPQVWAQLHAPLDLTFAYADGTPIYSPYDKLSNSSLHPAIVSFGESDIATSSQSRDAKALVGEIGR